MVESDGVAFRVGPLLTGVRAEMRGDDVDDRPDIRRVSIFHLAGTTVGKVDLVRKPNSIISTFPKIKI